MKRLEPVRILILPITKFLFNSHYMPGIQQVFNKWKWSVAASLSHLCPRMLGSSLPLGFQTLCCSWAALSTPMSESPLAGCSEIAPASINQLSAPWCWFPSVATANRTPGFGSQLGEAPSLTGTENA